MENFENSYAQEKFNTQILNKMSNNIFFRKDINNLDITEDTPEKAFTNIKYYNAMKTVPLVEKKALFLLVVCEYSLLQVSTMLRKTPSEILHLASLAIRHFKLNLKKGGAK